MSSVVSRRPPACAPTSQSNDRRWMSMRLGTSRDLFRRAKERRARGAATLGKTATPQGVERRTGQQGGGALRGKARLSKIARGKAAPAGGHSALTDPARSGRVCGAAPVIWAATTIGRPRKGSASARFAPPLRCAPPAPAPPSASAAPSAARRDGVETTEGRPPGAPPRAAVLSTASLLELDAPAGLLELGLELLGLVALDALLDGLGRLVDEGLGLLEAEAGRRADDLDDLDLLVAGGGEDDVDRRARLLLGAAAVAGGRGGRGRWDGRRRGAGLLLERLVALGQLEHRDALELVDPLLGRSHVCIPPVASVVSGLRRSVRLIVVGGRVGIALGGLLGRGGLARRLGVLVGRLGRRRLLGGVRGRRVVGVLRDVGVCRRGRGRRFARGQLAALLL